MPTQTETLEFQEEVRDQQVALTLDEAAELRCRGLDTTAVGVDDASGQILHKVWPNHHVGYFRLRSGRLVLIQPKVPIANVFSLLALAYKFYENASPFLDTTVPYSTASDRPLQALVEHFAALVENLLREGLLRRYIEREENIATVRGRLVFQENIRQNLVRGDRLFCRFSVSDVDVLENRLVLWTLLTLQRSTQWPESLRQRLQGLILHFGGVTPTPFSARNIPRLLYDRLNERYSDVHRWCRFFLEQITLVNATGKVEFFGFCLNMFELFERFVFSVFEQWSRKCVGVHVRKERFPLDRERRVGINPDVIIRSRSATVVADAKYKVTRDDFGRHPDVYQLVAYSTVLGLVGAESRPQAFLVYPASERRAALETDLHVVTSALHQSQLTLRTLWLDLSADRVVEQSLCVTEAALAGVFGNSPGTRQ